METKNTNPKPWTLEERRKAVHMRQAGMPLEEIAKRLDRTVASVLSCWKRYGKSLSDRPVHRDRYIVKRVDFTTGKVETFKEVMFANNGGPTGAWWTAISIIKMNNLQNLGKDKKYFFWLKYQ
jgi:hypothetical protein